MSNNSKMAQNRAIVIMTYNRKLYMVYPTAPFSVILSDP